ncbi:MAG: Dabb family protein [bacterium]|nr:Dabb family protein [bacterium]
MIKHIVLWSFRPQAEGRSKQENIELAREKLLGLKDSIKEIKSLEVGINSNAGQDAFDLALYSEFENEKDLDTYQKHPEHLKAVDFLRKVRDRRVVADYQTEA